MVVEKEGQMLKPVPVKKKYPFKMMNRFPGNIRRKILPLACLLSGWVASGLWAQSGPVAAGGLATGSGGEVNFSLGQVDNGVASGAGGTLLEGLQQPEDSLILTTLQSADSPALFSVTAYPNPSAYSIVIGVKNGGARNMSLRLYNIQGKLVLQHKLNEGRTDLPMARLASGIYFLNVLSDQKLVKQFKFIKE